VAWLSSPKFPRGRCVRGDQRKKWSSISPSVITGVLFASANFGSATGPGLSATGLARPGVSRPSCLEIRIVDRRRTASFLFIAIRETIELLNHHSQTSSIRVTSRWLIVLNSFAIPVRDPLQFEPFHCDIPLRVYSWQTPRAFDHDVCPHHGFFWAHTDKSPRPNDYLRHLNRLSTHLARFKDGASLNRVGAFFTGESQGREGNKRPSPAHTACDQMTDLIPSSSKIIGSFIPFLPTRLTQAMPTQR